MNNGYPNEPLNSGYIPQAYIQQQATQMQNCANAPPTPTRLSGIAAHQESLNAEIGALVGRFQRLADRMFGAQPAESPKEAQSLRGAISGAANVIEGHQEQTGMFVARLQVALERLEAL